MRLLLKVYVVTEEYGQYSDYMQGIIGVYSTPRNAMRGAEKVFSVLLQERTNYGNDIKLDKWKKSKEGNYYCSTTGSDLGYFERRDYTCTVYYLDDKDDGEIIEKKPRKAEDLLIRDFNFGE